MAAACSVFFWDGITGIGDVFQPQSDIILSRPGAADGSREVLDAREASKIAVADQEPFLSDGKDPEKLDPAPVAAPVPPVKGLSRSVENAAIEGAVLTPAGVVEETNKQRQIYLGAGFALKENALLDKAAQNKVNDMFAGQYFEHTSPKGATAGDLATAAGYVYVAVGENLAMGGFAGDADLVRAWMDSPGHRENILKAGYKEIGVAVGYGTFQGRKTWLAVQEFGVPKTACPQIDAGLSAAIDAAKKELDIFNEKQKKESASIETQRSGLAAMEKKIGELAAAGLRDDALSMRQELVRASSQLNDNITAYNATIISMRSKYEEYKKNVQNYNFQITAYNACVESLK